LVEVGIRPGLDQVDRAEDHVARRAVDREQVALPEPVRPNDGRAGVEVDLQRGAAGYARLPHAACDHRCVRRHAAASRQHTASVDQPMDVVRRSLRPDEDDKLALLRSL